MRSLESKEMYADAEVALRYCLTRGRKKIVRSQRVSTYRYRGYSMPRYVAFAEYASPGTCTGGERLGIATGIGLSIEEASLKSLAEAYERYSSGNIRRDLVVAGELMPHPIYDVCKSAPLHPEFIAKEKMLVRAEGELCSWVAGNRLTDGTKVIAPVDQVFYQMNTSDLKDGVNYHSSSSGVAAHSDLASAITAGLFELIERDAVAVTWYSKRIPSKIPIILWDEDMKYRVSGLEASARREVVFCDLTLDTVPVVMCIITGPTYPHLAVGCSANWNHINAMSKALDEAELMFHTRCGFPVRKRNITLENVRSVEGHALLWSLRSWAGQLDWLLSGEEREPQIANISWQSLIKKLDPAVFGLAPEKLGGLSVVRVMSNELMPLTFGFGSEHYRHPRLKVLGFEWAWSYPATPHCLA